MDGKEVALIKRAREGDSRAFEELVCLHDRRVLQVAVSMMGNVQDAYDVYQDTFIRAFTRLDSFRFDSEFSTWLLRITINLSINAQRKRRWRRMFSLQTTDERSYALHIKAPREEGPEQQTVNAHLMRRLERSLERLSDRERAVFILKHQHEYKIREIAEMIGCAEGTVKNYLFRATEKLKVALKPDYQDLVQP